ncbi:MAG TPA: amidohydrolase family protein, partial [Candidatus Eisenbacteria bacterium]|nr:amidohydrolase family protein [Candidatus Eisenbacteria bacterium]
MDEIADRLVLVNGRILTFDSRRPVVSALAVADGRITATGGRGEVERRRDRSARVIDLRGATVIPGLVDAHAHLDREGLKLIYPSLARCRSIADIQRLVRGLAARRKAGEWIVTMPIGTPPFYQDAPGGLAERRWPTRAELDAAAPDHPVYIRGIWGYWNRPPVHSVANSRALARAGVTRDTVPPPGVEIAKDAAGEPTGLFIERNLIQTLEFTLMREAPRFTAADRLRALRVSQRHYAARGVTAVYEGHGIAPEVLAAYRQSHARGELRLRCALAVSPTWDAAEAGRAIPDLAAWAGGRGLGDDRLRVSGVCLHYGGDAGVARILHEAQPYTGWAGFVESANDAAAYLEQAELAARHGLRVNTLVTRCLPEVLDAWEAVARRHPIRDLRWVLVHLNAATPEQLARIRGLGVVATTNPISYLYRSAGDEVARLGGAADQLLPHRSLAR